MQLYKFTILVHREMFTPYLHPYTHHRFLRFFAVRQPHPLSRVRRQGGSCQTNADCFPSGVNNVSSEFVSCVAGQCVCMECFMSDDDTGRCRNCSDYRYDSAQDMCGVDNRPRQLTAFLLSLFLSSTGAANFYIGQDGLGKAYLLQVSCNCSYLTTSDQRFDGLYSKWVKLGSGSGVAKTIVPLGWPSKCN